MFLKVVAYSSQILHLKANYEENKPVFGCIYKVFVSFYSDLFSLQPISLVSSYLYSSSF